MYKETLELRGHIIDSLTLPKILDNIISHGGDYKIEEILIGHKKEDPSYARIAIQAASKKNFQWILKDAIANGAIILKEEEVVTGKAPRNGIFPDDFYSTTNLPTFVLIKRRWIEVKDIEMDCGIVVHCEKDEAVCAPMCDIRKGDHVVINGRGIKVTPVERARGKEVFSFMSSAVSYEKPKLLITRQIADYIRGVKKHGKKVLFVAGPAVVHTGAGRYLSSIIRSGYVDILFAGNALAVHDIESALYGTSLGISLEKGIPATRGHEHHMRAINTIRAIGSIRTAVNKGVLRKGIMYSCIKYGVDFVLAGSIRDDGPLPEVITDTMTAQRIMRSKVKGVGIAIMLASALHSIATGNLLPSSVKTVCVDIDPSVVTKLTDRGTFQAIGLVTDLEPFLRELAKCLSHPS